MIVYVTIMALIWVVFCSRFRRSVVWAAVVLIVGSIGGAAAMIRDWHWSGDSFLTFEWRWQKSADERLDEYLQNQKSQSAPLAEAVAVAAISAEDMPAYRGLNRDGVVIGPPLCEDWSQTPPAVIWKHAVGGGYAQPVVVGNSLITIEQRHDNEVVALYDARTGAEVWTYSTPAKFDEFLGGPGPRATPTVHEGRIYALGGEGHLVCLDLASGRKIWTRELLQELGVSNQEWGITSSPLVHGDRLIVNVGGYYGGGLVTLKLADGTDVWKSEGIGATKGHPPKVAAVELEKTGDVPPPATDEHAPANPGGGRNRAGYAAPIVATIAGVQQILNFDGLGLWASELRMVAFSGFTILRMVPGSMWLSPFSFRMIES